MLFHDDENVLDHLSKHVNPYNERILASERPHEIYNCNDGLSLTFIRHIVFIDKLTPLGICTFRAGSDSFFFKKSFARVGIDFLV